MFTDLVDGPPAQRRRRRARAFVETSLTPLSLGESVSVNGACLTVDRIVPGGVECDMSSETLARTTLGTLPLGARVHLGRATPRGGRMGGHMVLGHVDGLDRVIERKQAGDALCVEVGAPAGVARYLAPKGSIAIDGASLTRNALAAPGGSETPFEVMLVPHTLGRTLLGELRPGAVVNLEVDLLARYVPRQLETAALAGIGLPNGGGGGSRPPSTVAAGPRSGDVTTQGEHWRGEPDEHVDRDQRLLEKLRAGGFWSSSGDERRVRLRGRRWRSDAPSPDH